MADAGWTKAEYDAAPEMAERLHRRILDLQDVLEGLWSDGSVRAAVGEGSDLYRRVQEVLADA